jgi:mRNA interferase MazF
MKASKVMRGDVVWVKLDPTVGTEIQKSRPAVVVSNDACNKFGTRVVVVPVTSNVSSLFPGEAMVNFGKQPGRALGDQLRSIDKTRIGKRIARLSRDDLHSVDEALRITLALA